MIQGFETRELTDTVVRAIDGPGEQWYSVLVATKYIVCLVLVYVVQIKKVVTVQVVAVPKMKYINGKVKTLPMNGKKNFQMN